MCTLLLWKHRHHRFGLIAAANRDEFLARPATTPTSLCADPLVVGGRDVTAGGTWFAINANGIVTALTNRRGAGVHDPSKRSRGVLVLEIARSRSIAEAARTAERIDAAEFNPFVLFAGDADEAFALHGGDDGSRLVRIDDGAHAITNWDLDAPSPPKAAFALSKARAFSIDAEEDADVLAARLHASLSDHGSGADDALCVHRPQTGYGTRSTSIALVGFERSDTRLYHAEGPACASTLVDVTWLLRDEPAPRPSNV
ncbi:MAG TPA: NRDE family protein [Candidatus Eremiobacteraceae bacterium]|nr:NRDE family protein [Candidatus Eremiobacteraceae bacterium]